MKERTIMMMALLFLAACGLHPRGAGVPTESEAEAEAEAEDETEADADRCRNARDDDNDGRTDCDDSGCENYQFCQEVGEGESEAEGEDAGLDAGPDASTDLGRDAEGEDAGPDGGEADARTDARTDAGADAGADASADGGGVCKPELDVKAGIFYCDDGRDNDCNGLTDCDDPECDGYWPLCGRPDASVDAGRDGGDGSADGGGEGELDPTNTSCDVVYDGAGEVFESECGDDLLADPAGVIDGEACYCTSSCLVLGDCCELVCEICGFCECAALEDCGPSGLGNGSDEDCDGETDEGCPDCLLDADCSTLIPDCFLPRCESGACSEVAIDSDGDGAGFCDDCDDSDASRYPGAVEACNGADDDCDSAVDEGLTEAPCDGPDTDACADDTIVCAGTLGFVCSTGADNVEVCNGSDEDCDGETDEGCPDCLLDTDCSTLTPDCFLPRCESGACSEVAIDSDGDGAGFCDDCDDSDASRYPGATEVCDAREVDEDCDGAVDEELTVTWWYDADGDGHGNPDMNSEFCPAATPASSVLVGDDCDDTNATVYPGATEVCNDSDEDCDGETDEGFDGDSDGFSVCADDCDDTNPAVYPGATEVCNGLDDDCGGEADEGTSPATPCDGSDTDACVDDAIVCAGAAGLVCTVGADNVEDCGASGLGNGLDEDCDGVADEGCPDCFVDTDCSVAEVSLCFEARCVSDVCTEVPVDADGDGVGRCAGDCDDLVATCAADCADSDGDGMRACDGDCDDAIATCTTDCRDADDDGVRACAGDCADTNFLLYPGNPETCDGLDQDCDTEIDEGVRGTNLIVNGSYETGTTTEWSEGGAGAVRDLEVEVVCDGAAWDGGCAVMIENPTLSPIGYDEQWYDRLVVASETRYMFVVALRAPSAEESGELEVELLDWVMSGTSAADPVPLQLSFDGSWQEYRAVLTSRVGVSEVYLAFNLGRTDAVMIDAVELYECLDGGDAAP